MCDREVVRGLEDVARGRCEVNAGEARTVVRGAVVPLGRCDGQPQETICIRDRTVDQGVGLV